MQIYSNVAELIVIWYLCWQYVSFVVAFRWTIKLKYKNKIEVKDKSEYFARWRYIQYTYIFYKMKLKDILWVHFFLLLFSRKRQDAAELRIKVGNTFV